MQSSWLLSVLDDLREFADRNGLERLNASLREARSIALEEVNIHSLSGHSSKGNEHIESIDKGSEPFDQVDF